MSIELRQLRYAVLTADTQSFSRAAASLRDLDRDRLLSEIEAQLIFDLQPQLNRSGKKRLNLWDDPIHIAIQNTISKCLDAHTIGPDRGAWMDEE